MLSIRLSRQGRKGRPFYRVVLTEHTKPAKSWFQKVLWWFNPLEHTCEIDNEAVKALIAKGAQPSERVAKLLFDKTKDELYKKYFTLKTKNRPKKKQEETK
jgi:small subunit ribosomal protein S16